MSTTTLTNKSLAKIAVIDIRPVLTQPLAGVGRYILRQLPWLINSIKQQELQPVLFYSGRKITTADFPDELKSLIKTENISVVNLPVSNRWLTLKSWFKLGRTYDQCLETEIPGSIVAWYVLDPAPWYLSSDIKLTVLFHDLALVWYPHFFPFYWAWRWKILFRSSNISRINTWAAVSLATMKQINWLWPESLKSSEIWPNPEIKILSQPQDSIPELESKKFFSFISTRSPRKNLPAIIAAWSAWKKINPRAQDYYLVIIGGAGWLNQDIADQMNIYSDMNILNFNYLPDAKISWVLHQAQGILYPSIYEGLGFPPLEARAANSVAVISGIAPLQALSGQKAISIESENPASIVLALNSFIHDYAYWKQQ